MVVDSAAGFTFLARNRLLRLAEAETGEDPRRVEQGRFQYPQQIRIEHFPTF